MSAAGAAILLVLILVVLAGTRLQALIGITCGVFFLSQMQQVSVAGINFFAMRFLVSAAFLRVLARGEVSPRAFNRLDWALISLHVYSAVVLFCRETAGAASALAVAADAGLCYVACRGLLRSPAEFVEYLRVLVFLMAPLVLMLAFERITGRPPLAFMSSGFEGVFTRGGAPRCMGSFRNPDLLGTVGSSFLPCYIGLALARVDRERSIFACILCLVIVWFSNSGGPVSATGVAIAGWALWPLRHSMRQFRWGIVGALALLALVMKAPIWYLLDRVSAITGGTGWHRAYLIDVAVKHLSQWWLVGMRIGDTQDWFHYTINVTGGADITNQYLQFGLMAGLGAVALLILVLTKGFSVLGEAMARARRLGTTGISAEMVLWGLGVMLAVHLINWFGIGYFDQFSVIWLLQLAAIASAATVFLRRPKLAAESVRDAAPNEASPSSGSGPIPAAGTV